MSVATRARTSGPWVPVKRRANPEQNFQIHVVTTILAPLEAIGALTYAAFSNGFKRTKAEAGIAKAMGQRAGAWDIEIWTRQGRCFGLELKSKSGVVSDSQGGFADRMSRFGCATFICRTDTDVFNALEALGIPLKAAQQPKSTGVDCLLAG